MKVLSISLALICAVLVLLVIHFRNEKVKEQEYLQEAVFRAWIRETETQCRKSAYVHKKTSPVVEATEVNGVKRIMIFKPESETSDKVKLATIDINFERPRREVNIVCSEVINYSPLERWPVSGGEWSPITLIKNELWKHFDDDPENESTYDFKQLPVVSANIATPNFAARA